MKRLLLVCVVAFLAACFNLGVTRLSAQVAQGSISGTVADPTGAAVAGATVTATSRGTGQASSTTTDSAGLFRLSLLPVGSYELAITKQGFEKLVLSGVSVSAGADHGLGTLVLKVGAVTTTLEVTAAPPLVQASEAQISSTFSGTLVENFPGVQENEGLDLLALTLPGVANVRDLGFSNTNGPGFSVNGLRGRSNDQQIDGQNNNDNSVAGPYVFLTNPDFVQEYQITTNNFGPEYGRNSGSVVNIITKSGTNNWHGSVFGTESNSALNTLSNTQKFFETLKKVPRFNDEFTGGTIGGPLRKDRVFLFGGFDNEIISSKTVYATGSLTPTPLGLTQLAACYPGSNSVAALQAFGPFGVGGGNPTVSGAPQTITLTGSASQPLGCGVEFAGVQRTLTNSTHTYDFVVKPDVVLSDKDRFNGRVLYQHLNPFNTDAFGTAAAGYPANVPSLGEDVGLSWTHTFSGRMTNEARFSYGRLNVVFGGNTIGNTVPAASNISQALARVSVRALLGQSVLGFGPATNAPQGRIVNTWQLQDNWTYVLGRHQLKAGVNYTRQRSPNIFLPNLNGSFTFGRFTNPATATAPFTTAACSVAVGQSINSFSAFGCDIPSTIQIAEGNPKLGFIENDTFLYFGDDFKLRPNLTLNLGLTWSYYGQPADLFHEITTTRESNPATAFWLSTVPFADRTFPSIPAPKNSWGPSVGFAWSPGWGGWLTGNGKTVLRGGYRLTYDPPYYNIYVNISTSAPVVLLQSLTGSTANGNPLPAAPFGPAVRAQLASSLTLGVFDPRNFNRTSITPDFGPDKVHSWTFGIQREFSSHAALEARYAGNHGTNLFQSINANPFIAGLSNTFPNLLPSGVTPCPAASAIVPNATGRVSCDSGALRVRGNTAYSDYNALQLEFRTNNLFNQLTMKTGYTFSKTTDNVSEIFGTFAAANGYAFSQNPLNFKKGEHGLSGLDFPQIWTVSFREEIPVFRPQHGVVGHILGGWGVSGTYIISKGQPYTPVQIALNCFSQAVPCSAASQLGGSSTFPFDERFDSAFNGGVFETARPFVGSPNAPVTSVGIFAADACNFAGVGCASPANTLLDLFSVNTTGAAVPVSQSQVRLIVNGPEAAAVFGTPFGNAGRNILRDFHTNTANFQLTKDIKFGERATLRWHMTMENVFNHPNFSSIDPFLDDVGTPSEGTGFGIPQVFTGSNLLTNSGSSPGNGQRAIKFGLKVLF
jgi:carboxypeptidase family protein